MLGNVPVMFSHLPDMLRISSGEFIHGDHVLVLRLDEAKEVFLESKHVGSLSHQC